MNKISEPRQTANIPTESGAKRSRPANEQTGHDLQAESQRFSGLLRKNQDDYGHDLQYGHDSGSQDAAGQSGSSPQSTQDVKVKTSAVSAPALSEDTGGTYSARTKSAQAASPPFGKSGTPPPETGDENRLNDQIGFSDRPHSTEPKSDAGRANDTSAESLSATGDKTLADGQVEPASRQSTTKPPSQKPRSQLALEGLRPSQSLSQPDVLSQRTVSSSPSTGSAPTASPNTDQQYAESALANNKRADVKQTTPISSNPAKVPGQQQTLSQDPSRRDSQKDDTLNDASSVADFAGDRILQGLLGERAASTNSSIGVNEQVTSGHDISELADRLAQQVLISDRSISTDSTVRIQLRESVLGGTEITINRDQGQLLVAFNAPDRAVAQQLSSHADDLQHQLGDKLKEPVTIQVNSNRNDSASDSGGDGRSRNRRDLNAEWQNRE